MDLLVPLGRVLLELAVRQRHHRPPAWAPAPWHPASARNPTAGPSARSLTRPDFRAWVISAQPGRPGRAAEQQPPAGVSDDHGLHGVLPALPGSELSRSPASGGWAAHPDLGPVDDPRASLGAEVVDDIGESTQLPARGDGASPFGRQGPYLTDCARDGGAADAQPAGRARPGWRRVRDTRGRPTGRPAKTGLCLAPAPTALPRGHAASPASWHSCPNMPTSATSSAITSGISPVIRSLRKIAARTGLPATQTMLNDQGQRPDPDAPPPTMHELVSAPPDRPDMQTAQQGSPRSIQLPPARRESGPALPPSGLPDRRPDIRKLPPASKNKDHRGPRSRHRRRHLPDEQANQAPQTPEPQHNRPGRRNPHEHEPQPHPHPNRTKPGQIPAEPHKARPDPRRTTQRTPAPRPSHRHRHPTPTRPEQQTDPEQARTGRHKPGQARPGQARPGRQTEDRARPRDGPSHRAEIGTGQAVSLRVSFAPAAGS